ncbi:hypothetical protein MYX76_03705 [Desulfobacterota bacterium AH_259_B03_O07]|nr:hypothetical protein [Desulfobacterota bacterium AH_259_B03_O07]
MATKTKTRFQGKEVEALNLNFEVNKEGWNEYTTDDGSVVKVKLVVTKILRVEDQYSQDGDPIYMIQSGNVVTAIVPEELKKKVN